MKYGPIFIVVVSDLGQTYFEPNVFDRYGIGEYRSSSTDIYLGRQFVPSLLRWETNKQVPE
jgi:hypothetical protein